MNIPPNRMGRIRKQMMEQARAQGRQASPDEFKGQSFERLRNVPSPGLGMFDATYAPDSGQMAVKVRLGLRTTGLGQRIAVGSFKKAFRKAVPQYWNDKISFVCTREGWDTVRADVSFSVEYDESTDAHYLIDLADESKDNHFNSDPTAVVQGFAATGLGAAYANKAEVPRGGSFGTQSYRSGEVASYRRTIIQGLSQFPTPVALRLESPDPTQSPVFDARLRELREFCQKSRERFGLSRRRSVSGLTLTISLYNVPADRAPAVGTAIKGRLTGAGISNPVTVVPKGVSPPSAALPKAGQPGPPCFTWTFDRQALEAALPARTGKDSFFAPPTIVHEFGHMLGLPDEYICYKASNADAMNGIEFLTANEATLLQTANGGNAAFVGP
ncbi:MAG: hypothetical protein RLN75_00975, partial [Longimicrobiales bacterium]